jgi:hypothetical protein
VANRKKLAKQTRLDERAQQIRLRQERERRNRNLIIAVFVALVLVGGVTIYVLAYTDVLQPKGSGPGASYAVADEGRSHVAQGTPISYKQSPPSSGNHYPTPGPWGPAAIPTQPGTFVHNLEHGGVVLVYTCSGNECQDLYAQAQRLYAKLPKEPKFHEVKFVSTPYIGQMPKKFALLAWDREQDMDTMDETTVADFYNQFVDHGREDVP